VQIPWDNQLTYRQILYLTERGLREIQRIYCGDSVPERPFITLMGESFGGLLSIGLSLRPDAADIYETVVPVNPATSFRKTFWPTIGPIIAATRGRLYGVAALASLVPTVPDWPQMLYFGGRVVSADRPMELLGQWWTKLNRFATNLSADRLSFRLTRWLDEGSRAVERQLEALTMTTGGEGVASPTLPSYLFMGGTADRMLPSGEEAQRLYDIFADIKGPQAAQDQLNLVLLQGAGHWAFDSRSNMTDIILSSLPPAVRVTPGKQRPVGEFDDFRTPDVEAEMQRAPLIPWIAAETERLLSPVFFSTNAHNGRRERGLHALMRSMPGDFSAPDEQADRQFEDNNAEQAPAQAGMTVEEEEELVGTGLSSLFPRMEEWDNQSLRKIPLDRPVLLVGNHNLFGFEAPLIISRFLREVGICPRALAHPFFFQPLHYLFGDHRNNKNGYNGYSDNDDALSSSTRQPQTIDLFRPLPEDNYTLISKLWRSFDVGDFHKRFGAVEVSKRAYYRLLQQKECILLYPGGLKEAFHERSQKYQLLWDDQEDFLRMAARFNATIIPFSAVGCSDVFTIVLDKREVLNLPFVGERLKRRAQAFPRASDFPPFVPPIPLPSLRTGGGERPYLLFGRPMDLTGVDAADKESCQALYEQLRGEVESGVQTLLEAREKDPFRRGPRRWAYELRHRRKAPSVSSINLPQANEWEMPMPTEGGR